MSFPMASSMLIWVEDVDDIKRSTISANARCCSSVPEGIWLVMKIKVHTNRPTSAHRTVWWTFDWEDALRRKTV